MRGFIPGGFALLLLLAACQPTPTPFPVDIPTTNTPVPTPGAPPSIRYALALNTEGFVADLPLLEAAAEVEQLVEPVNPADLGGNYQVIAAYGEQPGATPSPVLGHVALVLNAALPPLDDPALAGIVLRAFSPQAMLPALDIPGAQPAALDSVPAAALRAELANEGWPDGFQVTAAYAYTPGAFQLVEQLRAVGVESRLLLMDEADIVAAFERGQLNLALLAWQTPEERQDWVARYGENNMLDLYTLPISYWAVPDLSITFSPDGWPLPSR